MTHPSPSAKTLVGNAPGSDNPSDSASSERSSTTDHATASGDVRWWMSCVPGISVKATIHAWYVPSAKVTALGRIAVRAGTIRRSMTGSLPTIRRRPAPALADGAPLPAALGAALDDPAGDGDVAAGPQPARRTAVASPGSHRRRPG